MMRRSWPTMMLTVIALIGVLAVLLLTGTRAGSDTRFELSSAPTTSTVVPGGSAEFQIQIKAIGRFHGSVALGTSVLPDGVTAGFDRGLVSLGSGRPLASAILMVRVSPSVSPGTLGLGVVATVGRQLVTSNLTLRIVPTSITDAGPPPVTSHPMFAVPGTASLPGRLRPPARVAISVKLINPHHQPLLVQRVQLRVLSTSKPSCRPSYFTISSYTGRYPLRLPAGQARTLAALGVPASQWPQLSVLNRPTSRAACAGVTVVLHVVGTATTG